MTAHEQTEILLVEDNPEDAELAMRALAKSNLSNKVFWVKDGEEALDYVFGTGAYAEQGPIAGLRLILLDLKMPKVDGIEVLKRLKGDERTKALPVVVLTSSEESRDVEECYRLGVNSYIVKPIEVDGFIKAVSEAGLYWMVINKPL